MFDLYAAEQQYRHDTWARERDHAVLAAMRERALPDVPQRLPGSPAVAPRAGSPASRTPWARPIGLHLSDDCPAGCAVA